MSNKQLLALVVAAAVLYAVWKARSGQPADSGIVPAGALDWAASPGQDAAYWALMSSGNPSTPGSARAGAATVTPGTMTQWLGSVFPGLSQAWVAPSRGTNPIALPSNGPPGALVLPGPVSPAQPTPQSAVESTSPWLPQNFTLPAPVSPIPWATGLTELDPIASLMVGSGDFIDAVARPAGDVSALRTVNG